MALCSSVPFLTESQSEANMQCTRIFHRHLFGQRATFQGSSIAISIASIERDTNIALEAHITVLKSSIRCEVWITQWSRAVARKAKDSGLIPNLATCTSHIFLVHEYCFLVIIRWAEKCMNALFTGYAMPLPQMNSVARWPNGRINTWPSTTCIPIYTRLVDILQFVQIFQYLCNNYWHIN